IDGRTGGEELQRLEAYSPGSPQLSRYRALNRFGAGPIGSTADLVIERSGTQIKFRVPRPEDTRSYFSNGIAEIDRPPIQEITKGIFYVNILAVEKSAFLSKLPDLANARGVIFDHRMSSAGFSKDYLEPNTEIIPRLTD